MNDNEHGGDIYSRKITCDFSANLNPLGMPETVRKALSTQIDAFVHYPDRNCTKLRDCIAREERKKLEAAFPDTAAFELPLAREHIVCGNGAADLIYRMVRVLRPAKALLIAPGFSEYAKALEENDCQIVYHQLKEEQMFELKEDILDKLMPDIDLLFLCNPNNPTGRTIDAGLMDAILEMCRKNNIFVIVDECFLDFIPDGAAKDVLRKMQEYEHMFVLKAFTKIFAMAGLRLGYGICADTGLVERIAAYGPCWNVSVPAQIAGIAAFEEKDFIERTRAFVAKERKFLCQGLAVCGAKIYPGEADYILFRVNEDGKTETLEQFLWKKEIAIRNCANYVGLSQGYYRIAVRTHEENEWLIEMIGEYYG